MKMSRFLCVSALVVTPWYSFAQEATTEPVYNLEEIIVTAQRREQALQDVPISVAVVTDEQLRERSENEVSDLAKMVPGFSFADSSSDDGKSIAIRGVGTRTFSRGVEQSVGTVVDGVVASSVATSLLDLSDVARVEVLRGPQGMLFGKNASAGLLNITTNAPTEEFSASLGASYAEENEVKLNGHVSGALGSNRLLGRLAMYSSSRDPMLENIHPAGNDYNDRDEWGLRGKLLYHASDELDFLLSYVHSERDHSCCTSVPAVVMPGSRADRLGTPSGPENDKINENDDSTGTTELDVYSLEVNYAVGDHTLTSITAYTESLIESNFLGIGSPVSFLPLNQGTSEIEQFTQELRLTSPSDQVVSYVAGLYYYNREEARELNRIIDYVGLEVPALGIPLPGIAGTSLTNNFTVENESYSAFAQLTWNINETSRLSLGARYNSEDVALQQTIGFIPNVGPLFSPEATPGSITASATDDAMSWRLIGEKDLSDEFMLYASASKGYKGPGANTLPSGVGASQPIVRPEIPTSYELGIKSQWLDNRVRFNAAAFYTTFEDFHATASDGKTPPTFFLANAGELETQGFELEFDARLTERLSVWGSLAYIDAIYSDYKNTACYTGQTAAEGCVNGVQDLTGAPLPNVAELSYSASARYDMPLESMPFDAFLMGSYFWQDEVQYNNANNPNTIGDAYGIADLTLGVASRDGRYSAQLYVKNVFDEYYVTSVQDGVTIGIPVLHSLDYTYTRRFGVSVQIQF